MPLLCSVTGRSLSNSPLKLLKSSWPRALSGMRSVMPPLNVWTSTSLSSAHSLASMRTLALKLSTLNRPLTPVTVTGALKVLISSSVLLGTWISKSVSTTLSLRRSTSR